MSGTWKRPWRWWGTSGEALGAAAQPVSQRRSVTTGTMAYLRGSATTTKERPSRPLPKWSYAACGLWLLLKSLSPMQRSVWIVRGLRESGYNVGGIGGVCASGPSWRGRR